MSAAAIRALKKGETVEIPVGDQLVVVAIDGKGLEVGAECVAHAFGCPCLGTIKEITNGGKSVRLFETPHVYLRIHVARVTRVNI